MPARVPFRNHCPWTTIQADECPRQRTGSRTAWEACHLPRSARRPAGGSIRARATPPRRLNLAARCGVRLWKTSGLSPWLRIAGDKVAAALPPELRAADHGFEKDRKTIIVLFQCRFHLI